MPRKRITSGYRCQVSIFDMKSYVSDYEVNSMYSQSENDTFFDGWVFNGGYRRWGNESNGYGFTFPLTDISGNYSYSNSEVEALIDSVRERFMEHFSNITQIKVELEFVIDMGSWISR